MGYIATLDLLHASIVAVTSEICSGVSLKPAVNITNVLRPGTGPRFLASVRKARIMSRAPKEAASLNRGPGSFGETAEKATPFTTAFKRSTLPVKFCAT